MSEKRKTIKLSDIVIIIALLIVAAIIFLSFYKSNEDDVYAEISFDGKSVATIKLNDSVDKTFNLSENTNVNFDIKDDKIRFINVSCPDKICEGVGFINQQSQMAVCMPNKVALRIISKEKNIDSIT